MSVPNFRRYWLMFYAIPLPPSPASLALLAKGGRRESCWEELALWLNLKHSKSFFGKVCSVVIDCWLKLLLAAFIECNVYKVCHL